MARVGPRKVCWPPTWLLISFVTSAARVVLSSTNPPTNSAGMGISRASPQTTMSFTPIDLDFVLACTPDWNIENSLTFIPPCLISLCNAKFSRKKSSGAGWRQAMQRAGCRPFLSYLRRIPTHPPQRGKVLHVTRLAKSRDAADRQRTIAVGLLHRQHQHGRDRQRPQAPFELALV